MNGLAQNVAGHAGVEAGVVRVDALDEVAVGIPRVRPLPQQYHTL